MAHSCPSPNCPLHESKYGYCEPEAAACGFFPLGWETALFRKKPYPDETYTHAISLAMSIAWNIANGPDAIYEAREDADDVFEALVDASTQFKLEHADFPGKSQLHIAKFNKLWNGKVVTLLKWFQGR